MSEYTKRVEVTTTGMVVAEVFAPDGRRTGLEFFGMYWPWLTEKGVRNRCEAAHAWADARIASCQRFET